MSQRWSVTVVVCLAMCAYLSSPAGAASLNVKALPAPCSVNATGNGWGTDSNGNGVSDDTEAFNCAIGLIPSTGGEIYVPAGMYILDSTISVTNKSIAFRGEGQRITNLQWHQAGIGNGISFDSNSGSTNHTLVVKSMSLLRGLDSGAGGAAIYANWQTPAAQNSFGGVSATIFDVHVSARPWYVWNESLVHWDVGILLRNATGARINAFNIHGWDWGPGTAAIQIAGRSIGVSISKGDLGKYNRGIHVKDESEAVVVENVETSENNIAFEFDTTGPGHVLANCHASTWHERAVLVKNSSEVAVTDNLIYAGGPVAIEVTNLAQAGSRFRIRGNQIATPGPGDTGIQLSGTITDSIVTSNNVTGWPKAIWLQSGVSGSVVVGNNTRGSTTHHVKDDGNNHVANNRP